MQLSVNGDMEGPRGPDRLILLFYWVSTPNCLTKSGEVRQDDNGLQLLTPAGTLFFLWHEC